MGCGGERTTQMIPDASVPAQCQAVGPYCSDATTMKICNDGVVQLTTDCGSVGQVCSRGRCTSVSCYEVEQTPNGAAGCLFYATGLANVAADAAETESLLVTNSSDVAVTVDLERVLLGEPRTWRSAAQLVVPPIASRRFVQPFGAVATGRQSDGLAVRIASDRPITLTQIEGDDADSAASNSAGTMLLPVHALGTHHAVMTYPQDATAAVLAVDPRGGLGRIVVIATHANTSVTLTPRAVGTADQFILQDGDVAQIFSADVGEDLTGEVVNASSPIAVLSGNLTTTYGREVTSVSTPDMALEQIPPLAYWGKTYVAAALPPQREACGSLFAIGGASLWRVMAWASDTHVSFDGPGTDLPAPFTLDGGGVRDLVVPNDVSFTVHADQPILVTQGMDCEPSLSLAVPVERLLTDQSFPVLPNFDQMVAVVRRRGDYVALDGDSLEGQFAPAGADFEVAQVPLAPCTESPGVCTHRLTGAFGMSLRGMDVVCGYALTVPTWKGCDPIDEMCVQ
jgi:hypothetical protein